jgi:hypothetical protein
MQLTVNRRLRLPVRRRETTSEGIKTAQQEVGPIVRSAIAVKQIAEDFVERGLGLFEFLQCGIECL